MNETNQIAKRLDQLGQELRSRPSIVAGVMSGIESVPANQTNHRMNFPRRLAAFVAAACAVIAVGFWFFTQPVSLYAQTVSALAKVKVVHVEGWTSRIVRVWPLEQPTELKHDRISMKGWYWYEGEVPVSHEQVGPVVRVRRGGKLQEYQADVDLLFVSQGRSKDHIERLSGLENHLRLLQEEGTKTDDLGRRSEAGKTLRGVRIHHASGPADFWFDTETHLPFSLSQLRSTDDGKRTGFELKFTYVQTVPASIATYVPPKAAHVRHGYGHAGQELAWNQHVQDIGIRIDEQPIDGTMAVLPREAKQAYSYQYMKLTPDGKHWVLPLDNNQYSRLNVKNFINLRVQHGGEDRAPETWRIEAELRDISFPRADLVFTKETPWQEWVQFTLNQIGLEYTDVTEERTFWIAKHDGRKLKPWKEVQPPVPYLIESGKTKRGLVKPGVGHRLSPATMHGLIADFNRIQNRNYTADHPIIVDQTGLPKAPDWDRGKHANWIEFTAAVDYDQFYVATDSPWFAGKESRQMARKWFESEFGVTMTAERRPITIHVIQRKK